MVSTQSIIDIIKNNEVDKYILQEDVDVQLRALYLTFVDRGYHPYEWDAEWIEE